MSGDRESMVLRVCLVAIVSRELRFLSSIRAVGLMIIIEAWFVHASKYVLS